MKKDAWRASGGPDVAIPTNGSLVKRDSAPAAPTTEPAVHAPAPSHAGPGPAAPQRRRRRRPPSAWGLVVFAALAAPTVTGAAFARSGVQHEESRILRERSAEAVALLSSTMQTSQASLSIIGTLAAAQDYRAFEQSAGLLVQMGGPGSTLGTATLQDGAFVVTAAVGGPGVGDRLAGEQGELAARALASKQLVAAVIDGVAGAPNVRTMVVVPLPGRTPMVVFQEGMWTSDRKIPPTPRSPFRELRGAVYAASEPDPAKLILTTEDRLPMAGHVEEVKFPVGADEWTLVVAARGSLVGNFAEWAPWILLGVGLLAAALAGAAVETQTRRRAFAQATVEARTAELEDTRHFLERLFAAGPTAVVRLNAGAEDGEVVYVSPNMERVLGIDLEQIIDAGTFEEWVHPEDRSMVQDTTARLAAGEACDEIEFRLRQPDDSYKWVSALWMDDHSESGVGQPIVVYLNDITARRRSEEAIRKAQQVSEQANRSKSEFLSRMSHELRTPLNSVLGFGQLLEIDPLTPDQRESVAQIMHAGRHLLGLINEVLDITRIESGKLLLSSEAVHVEDLVRDTVDLIRPLADQRQINIVADWEGMSGRYLYADQQRAKQVLLNLLSNAVKYNRPRGTVAISCIAPDETRLRISVADTGAGIRADQMGRLFSPFERLDAAQTEVEGTGIGLTLSRYLTQAMGGTLDVESVIEQGSTFSVTLPAAEGPVNRFERLYDGNGSSVAANQGPKRKVLCIEDNPSNLTLVKRILDRRPDIEVVAASQGALGVELAVKLHPALVLLDLHLPDIPGEQILHRLRSNSETSSIPVAILSADATIGQSQRLLAAGAVAYMSKPLDVAELLRLVDEMVTQS
jgi:PAS domain S-box-containing protein